MKKYLMIGLSAFAGVLLVDIDAQAANVFTYSGSVELFQCPFVNEPLYSVVATGVTLTLTQNSDGSYTGELNGIQLNSFYESVKSSHSEPFTANPMNPNGWNWDNFANQQAAPNSNQVSVPRFSPDPISQMSVVIGGVQAIGLVDGNAFNVGTEYNGECNFNNLNPVGLELQLYSNTNK